MVILLCDTVLPLLPSLRVPVGTKVPIVGPWLWDTIKSTRISKFKTNLKLPSVAFLGAVFILTSAEKAGLRTLESCYLCGFEGTASGVQLLAVK